MKHLKSLVLIAILCILLSACSTTKPIYVPIEHTKLEYVNKIDTVVSYDSIYYFIEHRNDTVFSEKTKYKYIYKAKVDTICKVDSIPIIKEVEVIKEVDKDLSWLQKLLMGLGVMCLGILVWNGWKFLRKFV